MIARSESHRRTQALAVGRVGVTLDVGRIRHDVDLVAAIADRVAKRGHDLVGHDDDPVHETRAGPVQKAVGEELRTQQPPRAVPGVRVEP